MNNITSPPTGNVSTRAEQFLVPMPILNLIILVYSMPIGSLIGLMLNILCLIVLCHRKLKGETYKYLIFKTVSHLGFLFVIVIWPIFVCSSCPISLTLLAKMLNYIFDIVALNCITTYAALVEIALSYDRLLMFKQQKSKYLIKLRFWPTTICFLVVGFVLNSPFIFAFQIEKVPGTADIWRLARTAFGGSSFYRTYVIVLSLIQTLVALVVLVVLNILVKIEFSKYMKRKKSLTKQQMPIVGNASLISKAKAPSKSIKILLILATVNRMSCQMMC
jgi:hypothetical protein